MGVNICLQTVDHHTAIIEYLQSFDEQTARFFAPHPSDLPSIQSFYEDPLNRGWCAFDEVSGSLVGYAILRLDITIHDRARMEGYGFVSDSRIDASFAPSVAAGSRGTGLANEIWSRVLQYAIEQGRRRIFLWGGVKTENLRAIRYYERLGFIRIGRFLHEGENLDMVYLVGARN
ncbi:MAG: GNAT family N-acetyltransferase [Chitinophagaceae bacterium]